MQNIIDKFKSITADDVAEASKQVFENTKSFLGETKEVLTSDEAKLLGKCFLRGACIGVVTGTVSRVVPVLLVPPVVFGGLAFAMYDGQKQAARFER